MYKHEILGNVAGKIHSKEWGITAISMRGASVSISTDPVLGDVAEVR
jgi:hypothetical protein